MPYIKQNRREHYDVELIQLGNRMEDVSEGPDNLPKGDLTYILYYIAQEYIEQSRPSYTSISTAISCLTDAAEELRRRHLNPYEDKKREENGDV